MEGRAEAVKAAVNELTYYLMEEIRTILKTSGKRYIGVDFTVGCQF